MFIEIQMCSADTIREAELLSVIQYLADIVNNTECQAYIDSMVERLSEAEIEYAFVDSIW